MSSYHTESYGIYIHAPWCKHHCPYCSFNVYVSSNPQIEEWKVNVLRDWQKQRAYFSDNAHSLYFGGGTPSRIPTETLRELVHALPLASNAEIGIELNPTDVSHKYLSDLVDIGFNRISLGVQSFQPEALRFLGRKHTPKQLQQTIDDITNQEFKSWSLDLIFGLPEHISYELEKDLEYIAEIHPPHISLYGLTIEPDTHFGRQVKRNRWQPLDPDLWVVAYERINQFLHQMNYTRYEVSNFAQPQHRSRHNESIWMGGKYAGLGPGAHAYLPNDERLIQHSDWLKWTTDGLDRSEAPTTEQKAIDFLITRLRHIDGFHLQELQQIGYNISPSVLTHFTKAQLLNVQKSTIALGPAGWTVADAIAAKLTDLLQPLENPYV